ncbi:ParA family protein [Streptomyces sp.]|uniref:ParA family protein n=1 Tax=Streptomyces sp. TaxID=1931 RepID=UPI002F42527F
MPTHAVPLDLVELNEVRHALQRRYDAMEGGALERKVLVVVNGKGGVGKSSLSAALAYALSKAGFRVLLAEMDQQGNNGEDLGFSDDELDDKGAAQAAAILEGKPLVPTGAARKKLDVVPGGHHLDDIVEELYCQRRIAKETGDDSWMGMYAAAIDPIRDNYDWIILDVAPGSDVLQLQALTAGDMVLVPSRSDPSSRKGLRMVAARFAEASAYNSNLRLLGVVLFGTNTSATKVQQNIKKSLENDLREAAPVFSQTIRHVEAAAVAARSMGRVPQEASREGAKELEKEFPGVLKSMKLLASDYQALAIEVAQALNDLNDDDDAEGEDL